MTLIFQNKLFPSICLCFVIHTMEYICLYFFSNHYYTCISLSFKSYCTILILYRKLTKIYEWPSYAFEAFQSQYRVVHNLSITNFFLTFFQTLNLYLSFRTQMWHLDKDEEEHDFGLPLAIASLDVFACQ